jgi:hypothetical protein
MDTFEAVSPSTKLSLFKVDIILCNGKPLSNLELCSADLENIWTDTLLRSINELCGYTSAKTRNNTELRVQYQLKVPIAIKSIASEAEFNHERVGPRGVEILRCRIVGLSNVRQVNIGERVKVTIINPSFEISPEQLIEWISKFARVHEGHR